MSSLHLWLQHALEEEQNCLTECCSFICHTSSPCNQGTVSAIACRPPNEDDLQAEEESRQWQSEQGWTLSPRKLPKDDFLTGQPETLGFKQFQEVQEYCFFDADMLKQNMGAYDAGMSQEELDSLQQPDSSHDRRAIFWCTENFAFEEPSLAWVTYGNEAHGHCVYSAAAIVINVPPYNERPLAHDIVLQGT